MGSLEEMFEAANNLGLKPTAQKDNTNELDLMGIEEFRFVRCAASVPVVGSLI